MDEYENILLSLHSECDPKKIRLISQMAYNKATNGVTYDEIYEKILFDCKHDILKRLESTHKTMSFTTSSQKMTLVVITANGCSACVKFKSQWPFIKKQLTSSSSINIVEIVQPKVTNEFDSSKYPVNLSQLVMWFPTLILVNTDEFKAQRKLTNAYVFNGEIKNLSNPLDKAKMSSRQELTYQNISKWLESKAI